MAGLAMETSKAEPADRNQAKAKLNRDAYVDSFLYVESYMDSNPYVESNVSRYAYVEVQLYLLLVASRTEKSDEETSILPPPMLNKLSSVFVRESLNQYLCDPQWFRDTASRGTTTIATPKSQIRTDPSDHGKAPSNIAP
ncbi:hypothetical protein F511_12494 [Dorcoceras hygrometricum]|uniref:Uncharacterized protein n=1 Tax=Dorcoceras hygrometricum TaxID=472368 RepID=A0A2Z7AV53_9LAMI|nr:hypothetical protein F511_12494 [Dorcoceras hygrometricum]